MIPILVSLWLRADCSIMMEGETEGAKPLIEDVIFYGILSP